MSHATKQAVRRAIATIDRREYIASGEPKRKAEAAQAAAQAERAARDAERAAKHRVQAAERAAEIDRSAEAAKQKVTALCASWRQADANVRGPR